VFEALAIVFVFDAAAHAELLEDGHHLADGQAGNLSGAAEGGFALFCTFRRRCSSSNPSRFRIVQLRLLRGVYCRCGLRRRLA
jgi:hypothetical protein